MWDLDPSYGTMSFFYPPFAPVASPKRDITVSLIRKSCLLTILLDDVLPRRNELCKALVLVSGNNDAVSSSLKRQVLEKVGIEVFFQGQVTHESHSANAAVKLHSLEDFYLSGFVESEIGLSRVRR